MKKIIEIANCTDCPYGSHTGGFTPGGAKPCCDHDEMCAKESDCFKRVIPYKRDYETMDRLNLNTAPRIPKRIPDWCPLTSSKDYCEANFNIDKEV